MKALELAAVGMDLLGAAVGGWYVAARYGERVRADADRQLAFAESLGQAGADLDPASLAGLLGSGQDGEDEAETEAEGLLAARISGFGGPVIGVLVSWWERPWRGLSRLGWFRLPLLAPVGVVLLALLMVVCALLLPVLAVRFLIDSGNDFRLRIVVLAFALGIGLQVASALTG